MCSSISALLRIVIEPLPVSYAFLIPELPSIIPPVGKSGPLTYSISPKVSISWLSIYATQPSITSPKLCGGIFVAIPTAIPIEPLTSILGNLLGNTLGSLLVSSKLSSISTVFLLISLISSSEILDNLASV